MRVTVRTPARRQLVIDSLGVGVATGAYGFSFGAIAATSGFTVAQTCALSLLVFTGASQFAMVGVVASGGAAVSGAATALLLGSRNTLYGLRLASLLRLDGPRRVAAAHLVIDESTAMALRPDDPADAPLGFFATGLSVFVLWNLATLVGALAGREEAERRVCRVVRAQCHRGRLIDHQVRGRHPADAPLGFFATGLSVFVLWNLATLVGALAGDSIGDTATFGLDAAVPAAFLALLWPRLDTWQKRWTALAAAALALVLVPVTTPGVPVIAAAGVALASTLLRTPVPPAAASPSPPSAEASATAPGSRPDAHDVTSRPGDR